MVSYSQLSRSSVCRSCDEVVSSYILSCPFLSCFVSSFFASKRLPISLIIDPSEAGARKTGLVGTMHWNDGHSIKETKMIFIFSVWLSAQNFFRIKCYEF